jgi:hypothetical protein
MIKVGKRKNLSTGLVGFGKTILNDYKVILQSGERIIETSYVCEKEGDFSKGNLSQLVKGSGRETFDEFSNRHWRHWIHYHNGVFEQNLKSSNLVVRIKEIDGGGQSYKVDLQRETNP